MSTLSGAAFDRIAAEYDSTWTRSTVGQLQRAAVWRRIDPLVNSGDRLLDIGCGTGEDALHFMKRGAEVQGIDASGEMVRTARIRGVHAHQVAIESLPTINGRFDGAISNFGGLNCVSDLESVAFALSSLIRRSGFLAICVIGACCAWETGHFLRQGQMRRAFRRWRREGVSSSMWIRLSYRSVNEFRRAFRRYFELTCWYGIGLCVPPSYIKNLTDNTLKRLGKLDEHIAGWPLLRALSDHRLLLFERL